MIGHNYHYGSDSQANISQIKEKNYHVTTKSVD